MAFVHSMIEVYIEGYIQDKIKEEIYLFQPKKHRLRVDFLPVTHVSSAFRPAIACGETRTIIGENPAW